MFCMRTLFHRCAPTGNVFSVTAFEIRTSFDPTRYGSRVVTRREQDRDRLRRDVLAEARRQLEVGGPAGISWRGLARSVGVGPSTLYTYFDGVDGLYTEVIIDGYEHLAAAVGDADDPAADPDDRIRACAAAYRRWALENRAWFNLLFTDVLAGYAAPPDGPTVVAQTSVFAPFAEAMAAGLGIDSADVRTWPTVERHRALGLWGTCHGLVSLEVNHHLDWLGDAEALFRDRLESLLAPDLAARPARRATPSSGRQSARGRSR